jgi:hypothetical protein
VVVCGSKSNEIFAIGFLKIVVSISLCDSLRLLRSGFAFFLANLNQKGFGNIVVKEKSLRLNIDFFAFLVLRRCFISEHSVFV